jgi:ribosome assembly protein YihI (activator of Der GTPase)
MRYVYRRPTHLGSAALDRCDALMQRLGIPGDGHMFM